MDNKYIILGVGGAAVLLLILFSNRKASVDGYIKDYDTGQPISGASLRLTNMDTSAQIIIQSDYSGYYHASQLTPGTYQFYVTKTQYETLTVTKPLVAGHTEFDIGLVYRGLEPD